MSEVRLQVKNLCKSFGITKAVQNVSFNVNKGEVHALLGENGAGKSTLMNILYGLYTPTSGEIYITIFHAYAVLLILIYLFYIRHLSYI